MLNKLIDLSIHHPRKIIFCSILLMTLFGWQASFIQQDGRIEALVSENNANIKLRNEMESLFGSGNFILIGIKEKQPFSASSFVKASTVVKTLEKNEWVKEVHSIFNKQFLKGGDGHFVVKDIVTKNSNQQYEFEKIQQRLRSEPIYQGNLTSLDYKNFALAIEFKQGTSDKMAVELVENVLKNNQFDEQWIVSGLPVIHHDIKRFMDKDMNLLVPLFLVTVILFLFISFRSLRGVLIPFAPILCSLITALGMMGLLGIKITIVTNLIPMLLIAIGAAYSIHFINQYYHQLENSVEHLVNIEATGKHISSIIFLSGMTTIAGFLSNILNPVSAIRDFSLILSIGVFILMTANLTLVPAILALLKQQDPRNNGIEKGWFNQQIDRLLNQIIQLVFLHKTLLLTLSILIIITSILGIKNIVVESSGLSFFKENSKLVNHSRELSKQYGGVIGFDFLIDTQQKNGAKKPEILKTIDKFTTWLKNTFPEDIKVTISLADYVKQMSKAYNGEKQYYQIPDESDEIAQYIEIYSWGADVESTFRQVVEPTFSQLRVSGRFSLIEFEDGHFKEQSVQNQKKIIDIAENWLKNNLPTTVLIKPFGEIMIVADINNNMIDGQLISLVLALLSVLIITTIVFRSFIAGLLCIIPVSLAILVNFGVMGLFNIPLNIATALVSSMAIGIGIDDTIHFLMTLKKQQPNSNTLKDSIKKTFHLSGRAIIYTTIALSGGYAMMLASNFTPVVYFGLLNIVTILFATFATLITLAAVILWVKPRFLFQVTSKNKLANSQVSVKV